MKTAFFLRSSSDGQASIYIRIDVAFTQEGSGIYIFIGEAF